MLGNTTIELLRRRGSDAEKESAVDETNKKRLFETIITMMRHRTYPKLTYRKTQNTLVAQMENRHFPEMVVKQSYQ